MTKINFGSGPYPMAGWINVDLDPAGRPEVVADLGRGLPFATGVADFIHTEDFIAQLDPVPLLSFLRECRRILKPDRRHADADAGPRALRPHVSRGPGPSGVDLEYVRRRAARNRAPPARCSISGMRLAGRFQYDFVTYSKLAADAGFDTVRVAYNESRFEALRGLDLRRTDEAVSMYLECTPRS